MLGFSFKNLINNLGEIITKEFFVFVFAFTFCFTENIYAIELKPPIELFKPIPEIKKAHKTNKSVYLQEETQTEKMPKEKIKKKDTPVVVQTKENKEKTTTNISAAIEDLKKIADTKWFKFKTEKDVIIISGMTKKENTKQEMEKYCKENKLKCKITFIKIM
ncbi:MAG: hypothetical protein QXV73_04935 [Candidatus Micrarchaeia archaeon]